MNFSNLITDLSQEITLDKTDTTNLSNLKRWINKGYHDFQSRFQWDWLETVGRFQTIPVYETGTVTCTQNSRTVTGSGTAFTSAMVGRYFNCRDNNDWYKIIAVGSGTSLTLDKPYLRSTVSGKNFYIWQRYYELNTDVRDILTFFLETYNARPTAIDSKNFPEISNTYMQGDPRRYHLADKSRTVTTYSAGTVSGTINTKTLTGVSTVWLDNVRPGDKVTVGANVYYVQTVDSDTQLTLVGNLSATVTTSGYTITREDIERIEFDYTPETPGRNINYIYLRNSFDMVNDNDNPDMPKQWHEVITLAAKYFSYAALDDSRESLALQEYEGKLNQIRREMASRSNNPDTWQRFYYDCDDD